MFRELTATVAGAATVDSMDRRHCHRLREFRGTELLYRAEGIAAARPLGVAEGR